MEIKCPRCNGTGVIETDPVKSPYTTRVLELAERQCDIMEDRGRLYGDSWKSEGPDGLMYNILRKLRRLWKVLMLDGQQPNPDDGLDLANYSIMLIALTQIDSGAVKRMRVRGVQDLFDTLSPRESDA